MQESRTLPEVRVLPDVQELSLSEVADGELPLHVRALEDDGEPVSHTIQEPEGQKSRRGRKLGYIGPCTVCAWDGRGRRMVEMMLRVGFSVRDCADFAQWQAPKVNEKPLSKSAIHRHREGNHFDMIERRKMEETDNELKSVSEMVGDMLVRFQNKRKDYVPEAKEMRDWLALDARIADIAQRRKDEKQLQELMSSAAYKPEEENNASIQES